VLRVHNVRVEDIPCGPYRSGGKSIADMLRFRRDLKIQVSALRSLDTDLVYVNGPRVLPGAAIAFGDRKPVLFHTHSRVPAGPSAWLAGWSLRRMDATVIACSRSVAPNVRVIPNGTPDLGFRERVFGALRIGIIGRISPQKGQAEFLDAARILTREFPDSKFVVCGVPISLELRKLAEGLPVDFLGWRDDVSAVLAELDLLVIASKEEGMPRVLLEAFSAGVPVVAFPVGGIPEVITDNQNGFLAPEKTAQGLAARIREITRLGQGPLGKVVENARRDWERRYTVEIYRKNVTDLMEHLVSDWRAEPGTESPR
jgi:glycosyltransferase involved in cell wall biosynthesis